MIKQLEEYTSTINGVDCICHPNLEDRVDKINEIVKVLNAFTELTINKTKKEVAKDILALIDRVCFSREWAEFRYRQGSNGQRDYIINLIKEWYGVNE